MSVIRLDGATKKFGDKVVVDEVSLEVERGEFLVLLGPPGAGKSTLLRCIAGLESLTGGAIVLDGAPASGPRATMPPQQRKIGMVFPTFAVWPHMTVEENIAFGLIRQKLRTQEIEKRLAEALDQVGLAGQADRPVQTLSGGELQRVALARAVATRPNVLLFDEPLANLDAPLRESMRDELRQLQRRLGIATVYATQDWQEALALADRIALMNKGRFEQIGTPRQLYRAPATPLAASCFGPANLLTGTVIEASDITTVRLPSGHQLIVSQTGFEIGETVRLVIRLEEVRLDFDDDEEAPNRLRGRLESCTFLGSCADVVVMVGQTRFRTRISPARDWTTGEIVTLSIDPASVALLPVV